MNQKYNNGHVIDVSKIPTKDYKSAAREWAEGSKELEELLIYCLENKIITQACCIGHKEEDMAFVQFELSERNLNSIIKIINRYYNLNGVNMTFVNQPSVISKFDIRVPQSIRGQFFKDMLLQLSNGLSININLLPIDMQSTLNIMMQHKIPNDYLEVQYSMNNNERKLFVATTNPNYSDTYWNSKDAKSWVEGSIGIEDTPDKILPIINDISKKTSLEYGKYIENQTRIKNIENTINLNTVSNQDTKNATKDEFVPIVANVQATRENNYAMQNNITIMEVLPGMSIEQVAKAVCGKRYICQFNNFEIDGTKYSNEEQIIEAYKNNWEEGKKRFLESKKQQEQLDNSIRKQQIVTSLNSGVLTSNEQVYEGGITK